MITPSERAEIDELIDRGWRNCQIAEYLPHVKLCSIESRRRLRRKRGDGGYSGRCRDPEEIASRERTAIEWCRGGGYAASELNEIMGWRPDSARAYMLLAKLEADGRIRRVRRYEVID